MTSLEYREAREEAEEAQRYNPRPWERNEDRLIANLDRQKALRFRHFKLVRKHGG